MIGFLSKSLLFPYYMVLKIRHLLYDSGRIKSKSFSSPIICIGNVTVGGTGKTPHTEMIVEQLSKEKRVAVLSRGYKRKSKGFRVVECDDSFTLTGDEPLQIKQKFPSITVAVCKDRIEGVEKLLAQSFKPEVIILDDAFQYRKIRPSHSILLIDSNQSIVGDNLLPIGRLRDLPEQIKRAGTIIITKSNLGVEYETGEIDEAQTAPILEAEGAKWRKALSLRDDQALYFSRIIYKEPCPVFKEEGDIRYTYSKTAICFSAIANDKLFKKHISQSYKLLNSIKFRDHKNFTESDLEFIATLSKKSPTSVIFTTEKDSMRLIGSGFIDNEVKKRLFYIPIGVEILSEKERTRFFDSLSNL